MDDFSAKAGAPNIYGVVGGDANAIAPGKRPLSTMTPTILTEHGRVALVIGTPGGSRIATSIFQVLTNWHDFHLPLEAAVAARAFTTSSCRPTPSRGALRHARPGGARSLERSAATRREPGMERGHPGDRGRGVGRHRGGRSARPRRGAGAFTGQGSFGLSHARRRRLPGSVGAARARPPPGGARPRISTSSCVPGALTSVRDVGERDAGGSIGSHSRRR